MIIDIFFQKNSDIFELLQNEPTREKAFGSGVAIFDC